jgi:stringent starvation protein B
MTKKRPYLLRAMHEWILDNDMTPHIVVDAAHKGLVAPAGHAVDGKLVLNVSPSATRGLVLGNEIVAFEARFSGVSQRVEVPVDAVLGVYARENGHGMIFSDEDAPPAGPDKPSGAPAPTGPSGGEAAKKPTLKVVK